MQPAGLEIVSPTNWGTRGELLRLSVQVAVPLEIATLKEKGGPNDFQWDWVREFADELGERGDILQFAEGRKGKTATMFARFAYALAVLSFLPGGITFAGIHFEAKTVER